MVEGLSHGMVRRRLRDWSWQSIIIGLRIVSLYSSDSRVEELVVHVHIVVGTFKYESDSI